MPDQTANSAPRIGRFSSVRARTTLVATAAVALTLVAAVAALTFAVERNLANRVSAEGEAAVRAVIDRLETGATPAEAMDAATTSNTDSGTQTYVAILDDQGDPVTGAVLDLPGATEDGVGLTQGGGTGPVEVTSVGSNHAITQRSINVNGRTLVVVAVSPLAEVVNSVNAITNAARIGVPLLILAVALITWHATGRTLRPIESIRTEVEALSTRALDRRVDVPATGDEVARLAETMNNLLARLEMASQRQREFVSDASHELRNPAASMRAELEVSLAHPDDRPWPETAKDVLTEATRLEKLIDDLLLLARTDEGTAPPTTPVDITNIVHEVVATANRSHTVSIETATDDNLLVQGSPQGLASVVRNLVDNAARHATGTVKITATNDNGTIVITVDDDGPGIPATDRERIFQRFTRLDQPRSRNDGGVGLGLAIVDGVVHQHHGTTTVGESPSGGARFEVVLPTSNQP